MPHTLTKKRSQMHKQSPKNNKGHTKTNKKIKQNNIRNNNKYIPLTQRPLNSQCQDGANDIQ